MWQGQQYQQRTGQPVYCQCQMPTASTAVLEARQPRSRAKWEAPTLQQLLWNQLARANLVRFARIPCLRAPVRRIHPLASSVLHRPGSLNTKIHSSSRCVAYRLSLTRLRLHHHPHHHHHHCNTTTQAHLPALVAAVRSFVLPVVLLRACIHTPFHPPPSARRLCSTLCEFERPRPPR